MALRLLKLLIQRQIASLSADATAHVAIPESPIAPECAIDNDLLRTQAREKFIAREEERYNALMGEFKDHGLVTEAIQDSEGRQGRWIWIPLGKAALERITEEMGNVEV
jgi:origin recognition complex subunit 2